jgi:hypothetical protein
MDSTFPYYFNNCTIDYACWQHTRDFNPQLNLLDLCGISNLGNVFFCLGRESGAQNCLQGGVLICKWSLQL